MGKRNKGQKTDISDAKKVKRALLCILAVYVILIVSFYFLAGDQLIYRNSRGNIESGNPDSGSIELVNGATIEQVFKANIDRIQKVGVQFGTYYRENYGTLTMELIRLSDGAVLCSKPYDVFEIPEGGFVEMEPETLIENISHELFSVRMTADSTEGCGITPLVSIIDNSEADVDKEDDDEEVFELYVNGEKSENRICFYVSGLDYIWTGIHYWKIVITFGLVLALCCLALWIRYKKGKKSYIIGAFLALKKYKFLINQLVSRDFKTRYKRSVLGVFWSVLNPLLMMSIQYYIFSTLFKPDLPYFAVYLLSGWVMFSFFSESTSLALTSIVGNAGLITKVYMPKYIYPLTRTLSSLVNLALSLIPLVIMCLTTGLTFQKSAILALYFFVCLVIFTLGMGMLLTTSMVFFRDTQFLWGVLSMMWMYATPIFYPESIVPDNLKFVIQMNPLYYFVKNVRICLIDGISPEPIDFLWCLLIALAMLAVGAFAFRKEQDKFLLYL